MAKKIFTLIGWLVIWGLSLAESYIIGGWFGEKIGEAIVDLKN